MKKSLGMLIVILLLSACTVPMTVSYTPSSLHTGKGEIQVGYFEYLPSKKGLIAPNQIKNTAIGDIILNENVGTYFSNALLSELKYAGYDIRKGDLEISGEINEFIADDLGYSIDWTLDVTYKLTDKKSGNVLARKNIIVEENTHKFLAFIDILNKIIRKESNSS